MLQRAGRLVSRPHVLALLGILAVAAGLRLTRLDLMEFKGDEATMHRMAARHARGQFQRTGMMSSVGVRNAPFSVHVFSLAAMISHSPLVMALVPAVLGTAAVGLCYMLTAEFFSRRAALVAAALFATSTWAVIYSRKIWAQDLLPVFVIMAFYSAFSLALRKKRWHALYFCLWLACAVQLHFSALAFLLLVPVLVVWGWRRFAPVEWALGLVVAVLVSAPYLSYQFDHDFEDLRRVADLIRRPRGVVLMLGPALRQTACLAGHGGFDWVLGASQQAFNRAAWAVPGGEHVLPGLVAACLLWALVRMRRRGEVLMLVLWLLVPAVALARQWVCPHYLIVTYPAQFMVIGVALDDAAGVLERRKGRLLAGAGKWLPVCAAVVLGMSEAVFYASFMGFVARSGGTQGDYGLAYRYKRQVAEFIERDARGKRYVLEDFTGAHPDGHTIGYLATLARARDQCERRSEPDVVVQDEALGEVRLAHRRYLLASAASKRFPAPNSSWFRLLNRFRFGPVVLFAYGPRAADQSQRK